MIVTQEQLNVPELSPLPTSQENATSASKQQLIERAQLNFIQRIALQSNWLTSAYITVYLALLLAQILMGLVLMVVTAAYWFPNQRFQDKYIRWWCHTAMRLMRIDVEYIDLRSNTSQSLHSPALWVSNHISWIDIIALQSLFPISFVAKAEIASWPLIGRLARACGSIFIKRGSGDSSIKVNELARHIQLGRLGYFFPEGTTTDGQLVKPFYPKLFAAAVQASAPIQPLLLEYVNKATGQPHVQAPFVGDDEFVQHIKVLMQSPAITLKVTILNPISSENNTAESLSNQAHAAISNALLNNKAGKTPL